MRFSSLDPADDAPRDSAPAPARTPAPAVPPPQVITTAAAPALEDPAGEEHAARWRQAVDRVKERKLLLGTCLEEGAFLGLAGGKVRVALLPEHAFHRAMLEMKENQVILNEELERLYGRGAALLCEVVSQGRAERQVAAATGAAPAEARAPDPPGEPRAGMVQRIVELFDGEVLAPGAEGGKA